MTVRQPFARPALARAERLPFPARTFDLVIGSPPYCDARTYEDDTLPEWFPRIDRDCRSWVDWMLGITAESLRVSKGAVIWVAAGVTRDRNYWPACEGLMWRWFDEGWTENGPKTNPHGSMYRTCYWRRIGIPGGGSDQWFRNDVEYCMCFKRPGPLPWADNTACGEPPRHGPGGAMSNRTIDGRRVRASTVQTGGDRSGERDGQMHYPNSRTPRGDRKPGVRRPIPERANPGNWIVAEDDAPFPPVIDTGSGGGGALGHAIAHENEAPFPVAVPDRMIRSLCPPGGIVLDPFGGSGTTLEAAMASGRNAVALDIRMSQIKLMRQRIERPHAPVRKAHKGDKPTPLFD